MRRFRRLQTIRWRQVLRILRLVKKQVRRKSGKKTEKGKGDALSFLFFDFDKFFSGKNQHRFGKRFAIGPYKETSPAIFSEKMLRTSSKSEVRPSAHISLVTAASLVISYP